ncbi:MAG: thioredoxin-disulfide reductase [bacterium]|nr:thioredoxin-disulfide reductase [bacterium]
MQPGTRSVVIVGSGPAGLTAAIYAARAELKPLVCAGEQPGGQLMITSEVENFPGFSKGILGPDLMKEMRDQAQRFDAEILDVNVDSVDLSQKPFVVKAGGREFKTHSIIIATGASSKWLKLESEQRLIGSGVSSCATCDGFFFKDKEVAVVGGGDAALEEALFLTKFATKVTLIHRRDTLRASKIMQERAKNHQKIEFIWNTEVQEVLGKDKVSGLKLKNNKTGQESEFKTDGLFVAIGHTPNTPFLKGQVEVDPKGYIAVKDLTKTSVEGVFVAGDVQDHRYRQAITAAGLGCMAAIDVERWLSEKGLSESKAPTSRYGA